MGNLDWYRNQGLGKPRQIIQQQRQVPVFTPQIGVPTPQELHAMGPPQGQLSVGTAMQYWRGSKDAATTDSGNCPACGSPNFMPTVISESAAGGKGGAAMGHCMACSYRGSHDVLSGPTMQVRGSLRGFDDPSIPVRQSRQSRQTLEGSFGKIRRNSVVHKVG